MAFIRGGVLKEGAGGVYFIFYNHEKISETENIFVAISLLAMAFELNS